MIITIHSKISQRAMELLSQYTPKDTAHPIRVYKRFCAHSEVDLHRALCLLHDIGEDIDLPIEDLVCELDVWDHQASEAEEILRLLTHKKGTPYLDYITGLAWHPIARQIKLCDLEDNLHRTLEDESITETRERRLDKYIHAMRILRQA